MTEIQKLDPVEIIRPRYLNEFRQTEHYQTKLILPEIKLTDVITANENMVTVYDGQQGRPNLEVLYRNPTARIITLADKILLDKLENPEKYSNALFSPETIQTYVAILEKMTQLEKSANKTNNPETKIRNEKCIEILENIIKSEYFLNSDTLWNITEHRIKTPKDSRKIYGNIIRFLSDSLKKTNEEINEYLRKSFEED